MCWLRNVISLLTHPYLNTRTTTSSITQYMSEKINPAIRSLVSLLHLTIIKKRKMIGAVYSKTCVKRLLRNDQKFVFKTVCRLMQVKSIAFYHLSLRHLICLFLSGRLRQVLL